MLGFRCSQRSQTKIEFLKDKIMRLQRVPSRGKLISALNCDP